MPRTVVCLGDVMTDVVARLQGPLVTGSDSPAPVLLTAGGSAANTAAWLAVSGTSTVFVGRVGRDLAGDAAVAALESSGVTCRVARDAVRPTGTCIVLVAPEGERTMVPDAGANAGLLPEDVPNELLGAGTHLHLSGYALLNEGSRAAALHAIATARRSGATVSVDAASAGPISDVGAETFLTWIEGVDALLTNADEATALTGLDDATEAARALTAHVHEVVVKVGRDGALRTRRPGARTPGGETSESGASDGSHQPEVVRAPAERVEVVDSTGAGDAFAAGWLPAWLDGADPAAALAAGCALAARAVTQLGARPT